MKFVVGENGRNPKKILPRLHFVLYKTHLEWQRCKFRTPVVGGKWLSACAMGLPYTIMWPQNLLWPSMCSHWYQGRSFYACKFFLGSKYLFLNILKRHLFYIIILNAESTAVEQAVAGMPVMQWTRVQSPVGTNFLGEVFSGFFLTCKTNVRKL